MRTVNCLIAGILLMGAGTLFAAQAQQGNGAKGGEMNSGKKILVVYYSRTGNTKMVAEAVAKGLNADIEQIIDKKDRSGAGGYMVAGKDAALGKLADIEPIKKNPADYDLVVLGTPIWSWTMTPAIRTYVTNNKSALKSIAVFVTAGGSKPDKTVKRIEELAGKQAVASTGFLERELKEKNRPVYETKLNAFVDALKK